jgi:hypothetical protein
MDDLLKTESGLIKTGEGSAVNPDVISESGLAMARAYAKRAIPAPEVGSASPLSIPTPTQETGIGSQIAQEARATTEQQRQEYEIQQTQKEKDLSRQEIESRLQEQEDILRGQEKAEAEVGLPDLRLEVADLTSQIEAREHALRRQVEQIESTPGLTTTQVNREINKVTRQANREIADLSIVQATKLRRQEVLETAISRRMQIDLAVVESRLEWDKEFYKENRDMLTKTQDRAFQLRVNAEEREYQEEMFERQQIGQVAMTAAQYGANATQIGQITQTKTWEEAVGAGSQFLGAGFALQVRSQAFSEQMQTASFNLQQRQLAVAEQQAELEALRKADEMNLKVGSAFTSDTRVQQFQISEQAYNRINSIAPDREMATFENISGNNSEERALATAFIRMTQPDIARSADAGDINASQRIDELITSILRGIREDKATLPRKLREMAIASDKLYNSSLVGLESATNDFETRLVSGVQLPNVRNWETTKDTSISSSITQALEENHSPSSILDYLETDPLVGNQIKGARGQFSDDKIIKYLLSL